MSSALPALQVHPAARQAPPARHALVRHGRLRRIAEFVPGADVQPVAGQACVVETSRGLELGHVLAVVDGPAPPRAGPLVRMATPADEARARALRDAAEAERARVQALAPEVRVVAVERPLEAAAPGLLVTYYAASARVDVPALLRTVEAALDVQVEAVQVGARERARVVGGVGSCGRVLCCTTFLRTLEPVTLRMAQVQGVATDPDATAGSCGRLKCCLRFEAPSYDEGRRGLPRVGWSARARRASGTVVAVDPLRRRVLVRPQAPGPDLPAPPPIALFADEVLEASPPSRPIAAPAAGRPLPLAGQPAPEAAAEAKPGPPPERGWSNLARRLWRRMGSGRHQPPED